MKRLFIILLTLCFICSTGGTTALAADANSAQVFSAEGFQQALDNPAIESIFIQGSFTIDRELVLLSNRKINISSVTNKQVTIYQSTPNTRHISLYNSDGKYYDVTFTDIIFDGKDTGGGVSVNCYSTTTFNNSIFKNNYTSHLGGGLKVTGYGAVVLSGCDLSNNTAAHGGGGLSVDNGGKLSMSGTTIKNNKATRGGGMWVGCGPQVNTTGSTISGNTASVDDDIHIHCSVLDEHKTKVN